MHWLLHEQCVLLMRASGWKPPFSRGAKQYKINEISILKVFIHRNGYICGLSRELKRTTNAYEQKPYRFEFGGWRMEGKACMVFGCSLNARLHEAQTSWKFPLQVLPLFHHWIHIRLFQFLLSLALEGKFTKLYGTVPVPHLLIWKPVHIAFWEMKN